LDQHGEVACLVEGEVAGDVGAAAGDAGPAGDGRVELRRGDDLVVEHDREPPARVAGLVAGDLAGELLPGAGVAELDADPPARPALRVAVLAGVGDAVAADGGRAELEQLAALVLQRVLGVLVAFLDDTL